MKEERRLIERNTEASALFLFCFLFIAGNLLHAGQDPDVSCDLSISPDSVYIGDPIAISLELTYPESVEVIFEGLSAPIEQFEVIEEGKLSSYRVGGVRVDSLSLTLTTFETGRHQLGPIEVHLVVRGLPDTLRMDGKSISVVSLLDPEASDIKDIKDLITADRDSRLVWILIAGAVLVILAYLFWLRKRHRPRKFATDSDSKPRIPPDQWALEALQKIERMELPSRGLVKTHYTLVSGVLRQYLNLRYGVVTTERTTLEIINELEKRTVPDEQKTRFTELLEESDLVKFAKYEPDDERSGSLIPSSREIVGDTAPAYTPNGEEDVTDAAG